MVLVGFAPGSAVRSLTVDGLLGISLGRGDALVPVSGKKSGFLAPFYQL